MTNPNSLDKDTYLNCSSQKSQEEQKIANLIDDILQPWIKSNLQFLGQLRAGFGPLLKKLGSEYLEKNITELQRS